MTGFLDLSLKCIDLDHGDSIPSAINMLEVNNNNSNNKKAPKSNVPQSKIKTPERHLVFLLLTLNIFRFLFYN